MILYTDFAEVLRRKLREYMNDKADHVATGGCSNWDEYKHVCGVIEGLAIAERELLDLVKDEDKADD